MTEQREGFWSRLFGSNSRSVREERIAEYLIHRTRDGARLRDVVEESYVRRLASHGEVEEILCRPELVHSARERLEEAFNSGELDWHDKPHPPEAERKV